LLSTAAGRSDDDRNKLDGVYKMLTTEGIPATLQVLVDRWFTESFAADNPELVQRRIDQVVETDADIFLNVFRIYAGTEMAPWLKEVNIPSLVLTGENDGGCNPRLNEFIVNELPDAELVILPGYRHSILVEAPNQTAAAMKDFILRRAS
jgi:3-oxoadipate enol-lactonase